MSNSYRYVDPDYTYIDPKSGVLKNLNPPDDKNVYDRYMQGTVNSDVKILKELIFELIS